MSTALQGRIAIRARQVKPGEAYAVEVKVGQFIQITDVAGKQVADFVAFNAQNRGEHLSVAATRTVGNSIMLQQGMQLVSNRRTPMFDFVEDSVGRHDMLLALCDRPAEPTLTADPTPAPEPTPEPQADAVPDAVVADDAASNVKPASETAAASDSPTPTEIPGNDSVAAAPQPTPDPDPEPEPELSPPTVPGCLTALGLALEQFGISVDQIPDPVNWFMNVGIKGRGELEIREPLSERNDYVVLNALMDTVVAITACSATDDLTNGESPTDILVRVYR